MIRAITLTGSDQVHDGGCRVLALHVTPDDSAGTVVLEDGDGEPAVERLEIHTAASGASHTVEIPGGGLLFVRSCEAVISDVAAVTVFVDDFT